MNNREIKAMMAELAPVIREFTAAALTPISDRLAAVEKLVADIPTPRDGKDADMAEVRALISSEVGALHRELQALRTAPEPPDIAAMIDDALAARIDVEDMERSIEDVVRMVVAEIPAPKDGAPGENGASVLFEDVLPALEKRVDSFLSAIPSPQDGKSVTIDDVAPMIVSEIEKRVSAIPAAKDGTDGKDGVGLAGAIIDRDGELVVTLSNGEAKRLGPVVGTDGNPGKPGVDGLGFDDLDVTYDGEKTVSLKFTKGDRVKEFAFVMPIVIDRGVYRDAAEYKAGDGVTWGGSFWIAQKDTAAKPDAGDDWRLSVKRGRDGKDGGIKEAKPAQPVRVGVPARAS